MIRILEPEVMDTARDAAEYDAMDFVETDTRFAEDALALIAARPDAEVLDIGTGTAKIPLLMLDRRPDLRVMAVDLSSEMLRIATHKVAKAGHGSACRLAKHDAKALRLGEKRYDLVLSNSVAHHIPDPLLHFQEMARVVKPDGALLIRDLLRPENMDEAWRIVKRVAAGEHIRQQQLFFDSLCAALTLAEVEELVRKAGLERMRVVKSSDRHWTAERGAAPRSVRTESMIPPSTIERAEPAPDHPAESAPVRAASSVDLPAGLPQSLAPQAPPEGLSGPPSTPKARPPLSHLALTQLSEEELFFRDSVIDFARKRVAPHVASMDEKGALDKSLLPGLFELGLMGIEVPEEHGGAGASFFSAILAVEGMAVVDPSVSVLIDVQNTLVANALLRWASDAQKAHYLPLLCREWIGSYALSEAGSGSDAFALATTAEKKGDKWVLNGRKLWITNANESELFLVFATVDKSKGYKGITAFIVERGFPGFSVGKKEDKLGIRASSTCELVLDDCEVPADNVLGEVGKGYKIAIETLNEGRIGIGAQMLGLCQGAFDYAMRYVGERSQFGQAIGNFQGMQFQYARVAMEIEAARLMVYNAARLKDQGKPFVKEAAMAKLFASEVAERTASQCVEFLGGVGFTKDYPMEKLYRDAKIGKIYEGTSNMQLSTIAKIIQTEYGGKG